MARRIPKLRRHSNGQAMIEYRRRRYYLGVWGSEVAAKRYRQFLARIELDRATPPPTPFDTSPSIAELICLYLQFAKRYYVRDGVPTGQVVLIRASLHPLDELFGEDPADQFGPKALRMLRDHMVRKRLSRTYINDSIGRVKRFFKWAVSEEHLPVSVYQALATVAGLQKGRSDARETEPVRPVDDATVDATLRYLSPPVAAMVQLQRLTGMRPGEAVVMRACDLDMTSDVWIYRPQSHKTEWRGKDRSIPLGPRAQAVIKPFLRLATGAYLFSPRDSAIYHLERRPQRRGTPRRTKVYPSELRRRERLRKMRRTKTRRRERFDTGSYRRSIQYAIGLAAKDGIAIPSWSPNQLRHRRATEIRRDYGVEAAQVALGHARADVTQVYAERDFALALRVARESG